jgi:hypothetical protein
MIRTTLYIIYFACLLVGSAESASLRRVKGGWELQADLSEALELQANATFDNSDECPVETPEISSMCNVSDSIRCGYGEESCCGNTYHSWVFSCSNGWWSAYYTDACLNAPLCCGPSSSAFQDDKPADLSDDASIINEIIQLFLPFFNKALQSIVPDPLVLPFAGGHELPELEILLGCLECQLTASQSGQEQKVLMLGALKVYLAPCSTWQSPQRTNLHCKG